ncbi:MAG: gamma-glutamylcyclotransferase [Streptosporangiaceae bacterium]|nr:gamma-glutamylcyclotransferase [Streptosporangiaceae bacterium]MBV9857802.1 gamma-glutamylcyclotransferase [Streptosporangiaceae bacterium]
MALYAAYGSNMDPAQMLARCPHSPQRGSGWLEGWRLTFGGEDVGWDGALTTVVEDAAQRVFVVLYDVAESDEKELDSWDGVTLGYYRKLKVRVQTLDGDVLAWLYVLNSYEGGLPSARHLSILVDAAIKAGAPGDYVRWLRERPCDPPGEARNAGPAWPALLVAAGARPPAGPGAGTRGLGTGTLPGLCRDAAARVVRHRWPCGDGPRNGPASPPYRASRVSAPA